MIRHHAARALAIVALFAALAAIATWPQVRYLGSRATPHQDVFFNMWRLEWVAHALRTPRTHVFDANIFTPEPRALAFSDAMLVEAAAAAPLLWAHLRPVLVHNLVLLGGIVLSAAAMFALVRYLTGCVAAGIIAGVIFAFVPYRFDHYMHMELQWTVWTPLAFLAMHRTFDTGEWKYGIAAGACVALQMMSSIYYGIFLATLLPLGALLLVRETSAPRRVFAALAAGAGTALLVTALYAAPYMATHARVGDRPQEEILRFSARGASYRAATASNWLYGGRFAARAGDERRLFPGVIPLLLATVGLLLHVPGRRPIVYLLLMVTAFEMSLGLRGYSYAFLYDHVALYRGLRALGRLGIFVVMFLAVLAGYGFALLSAGRPRTVRFGLAAVLVIGLLGEYHLTVPLEAYPNAAPPVYRFLAAQPRGIVAEFPAPQPDALPGHDPEFAYMSTFHWFPLVNGYSGTYPASYLGRIDRLRDFPDARSIDQLRRDQVQYVVVHSYHYAPPEWEPLRLRLETSPDLIQLGRFDDGNGPAFVFRLR
jgi:hypothetical protein